ncbi:MAG: ester cyclase [Ectothiorhodospiraceae bacterium]|nr:ester cyclase [Ectothiorhodospiraceae bacterium]
MTKLIQQYVQIWNTKNTENLPIIFSKSALYKDALQDGNAIGVLSASIKETARAFPNVSFEIITLVKDSTDSFIAFEWSMKGTNTGSFFGAEPTNKQIEILGADIIQIKDEKIISIRSYYDSGQFAAQLGI